MRLLFSLSILSILIFSLSCKTTTQNQSSVSSSEIQQEEPQQKPQSIVIPVSSLGDVSETRQQILQNSLEDELKEHFTLISQERFEEAQEKAFEELDYEECTEDQCIMLIQEMLQVENVFHLQVIGEGSNTQLSLSWRTLDENKKETDICLECETFEINLKIKNLISSLIGIEEIKNVKGTSKIKYNDKIDSSIDKLESYFRGLNISGNKYTSLGMGLNLDFRIEASKYKYKDIEIDIQMNDFSDLKQDYLMVRFDIKDFQSLSLEKINECVNRFNSTSLLDVVNKSNYLNVSIRRTYEVNAIRCVLSKLNIEDRNFIKNTIFNMNSVFSEAFNNGIIVLSRDSNIPENYWSMTKESEEEFWYYISNQIENNSKKYYK